MTIHQHRAILLYYLPLSVLSVLAAPDSRAAPAATFETHSLQIDSRCPVALGSALLKPDFMPLAAQGRTSSHTQLEVINYLSANDKPGEQFYIDGETWRIAHFLRYAISNDQQVSVELPWMKHHSGISDRFIYEFHDLLSLPQNGRTQDAHDRMYWGLRVQGQTLLRHDQSMQGLGDIRLLWHQRLSHHDALLGLSLKLPTGDFSEQTGSEQVDLGLSLAWQNPDWLHNRSWLKDSPLALWYGVALNHVRPNDALAALDAHPWVLALRVGTGWQIGPRWRVKTQLDANTSLFDSAVRELGWQTILIGFASETRLAPETALEVMIVEDLRPRSAPDVVFSFGLHHTF
jgi:hypothetical protein